ncbi:MAG TPA: hypothetical protein VL359_15820 [bacterium]|nr:hypothetical protein [bacterium]
MLGAAYFFVRGMTTRSSDGRQAIALSPPERDMVLAEMRGNLAAVQGVLAGLLAKDMQQVSSAARASGMAAAADVTPSLLAKLPLAFKDLGFSVHRGFDELADAAQKGATPDQVLSRLNTQLQSCMACHAAYRLP